ncbi:MAG: glycosyltransferase, partial [Candidatus Doudnabacteria bacterium]|nr:glycosyltransferase [Candidatus Doudnabacteria bacterium]
MTKVDIAGVYVDAVTKNEALNSIKRFLIDGKKHYIVTPYSEQIVFALRDEEYRRVLNNADLALPDGIGILWASKFLSAQG